ncbi:hypothetical protein Hdeb2414_s0027g00692281 [Helianthus debilis subsp. tardiflorus]
MDVNNDDHQELESLETLSLTDFPLTRDENSCGQDHDHDHNHRPPPSPSQDLFEFCSGESNRFYEQQHMMSDAEDMISGGKLVPTNPKHPQRARCESMRELKSTNDKGTAASTQLFRNSYSFDSKKRTRNLKLNYEPTADNNRNSLSNKSSSSRWADLMFAPLKVPAEMDLKDIRNRQLVKNTSKSLFPTVEPSDRFAVNRVGHHRKTSWGVLGFLSCKRSGSVAVTMPLS